MNDLLKALSKPFHPSHVSWKPGAVKGERALALAYADLRAYMNRLDDVCGGDWSVTYEPWGENRIICKLTIAGITRSSTGESSSESERSEIGGTVAEAQAMKRACAMFGLGRYLYTLPTGWADYDPKTKQFTAQAKAKLTNMLVQHYRRANESEGEPADLFAEQQSGETSNDGSGDDGSELAASLDRFNAMGKDLYGDQWEQVCRRNVNRISGGTTQESGELAPAQIEQLIAGMLKLKERKTARSHMAVAA
ncbi:MAG: hypothetical protein IT328_23950 [Caldilineaceae bacterium]|nr:hypothetical protein [Caldilineaceae bacterium]